MMVFITYEKDVTGHPPNKNVMLRMMTLADGKVRVLARLFGGRGHECALGCPTASALLLSATSCSRSAGSDGSCVTATAFPFCSPCDILRLMTPTLPPENLISQINSSKTFFENSTRALEEADSNFRPGEGTYTAAQQIAHTAQTIEWFIDGIRRPEGFDLDFEKHAQAINASPLSRPLAHGSTRHMRSPSSF